MRPRTNCKFGITKGTVGELTWSAALIGTPISADEAKSEALTLTFVMRITRSLVVPGGSIRTPVNSATIVGPVTNLGGRPVRPHDIEIMTFPAPGSVPATIERLVRLGFEVRVDAIADGRDVWVQITRGEADRLDLAPGSEVFLRPVADRAASLSSAFV